MTNKLTYTTPAYEWTDGLPFGNGSIGAMLWGEAGNEIFTLNHNRLFRNNIKKDIKTAHLISKIRELMLVGKTKEAQDLFNTECGKYPTGCNAYQVFGEIKFNILGIENVDDYKRMLNMSDANCEILYSSDHNEFSCFALSSIPKNILAVKYESKQSKYDCEITYSRPRDPSCLHEISFENNILHFDAEFVEGVKFKATIQVIADGSVYFDGKKLNLNQITTVELRIALATSFETDDLNKKCMQLLNNAGGNSFENLKTENAQENKRLYERVELSLNNSDFSKITEEHYNDFTSNKLIDNAVYQYLFNTARFYTICSSNGGSIPMNLQGIWNDSISPMWECGFTTDLNIQMHHWLTLPANLAECQMPLFKWLKGKEEVMQKQAKNVFGCGGYYIPQYTDNMHTPTCWYDYAMFQVLWSGGATWLAQHFYEHWKYTKDIEFLNNYALPYMKGCAEFYLDFLVKDENGNYITLPSVSPENTTTEGNWLVNTSTIDITLVNELFGNLIRLDDELGLNEKDRDRWEDIIKNIKPYPINQDGILEEWVEQVGQNDPYHRHLSHLYGLFPSKMFSEAEDKTLYNAAIKALEKRIGGGFDSAASWSHAWYACCYARVGDGDKALECIDNLLRCGTLPNFLTTHNDWRDQGLSNQMIDYKLIQIDALLGAATAICEMFVQSFDNVIKIAPAIPKKWQKHGGEISGLKTYGGHEVSFKWSDGKLTDVKIKWNHGNECKLVFGMEYE